MDGQPFKYWSRAPCLTRIRISRAMSMKHTVIEQTYNFCASFNHLKYLSQAYKLCKFKKTRKIILLKYIFM